MFKKQTYAKNCDVLSRSISQSGWDASLHWLPLPLLCFVFFLIWLCSIFITVCRLSLVVASRKYSSLHCMGRSLRWLLLWSTDSGVHGLRGCGSQVRERGLGSCGTQAQLLCSMWNHSRPGIEPTLPALASRFLSTLPAGTSHCHS